MSKLSRNGAKKIEYDYFYNGMYKDELWNIGNSLYGKCSDCNRTIRLNGPLRGFHICD